MFVRFFSLVFKYINIKKQKKKAIKWKLILKFFYGTPLDENSYVFELQYKSTIVFENKSSGFEKKKKVFFRFSFSKKIFFGTLTYYYWGYPQGNSIVFKSLSLIKREHILQ